MSKTELKPCPFCGGEAKVEYIPEAYFDKFVAHCKSSKCIAFYVGYVDEGLFSTEEKAIKAWNTRTNTIPVGNGKDYTVVNE